MAKYSYEFKQGIVKAYLRGEGSFEYLANKYGMPESAPLKRWIRKYQEFGSESLRRSREKTQYSFTFKLHVVELYLNTELSYLELAVKVGVKSPSTITQWVNAYRAGGAEALQPKPKGRRRKVDKKKISKEQAKELSNEKAEYLKQLEEENLRLRIENAFLKELRRLRLEEEAQRTQRELQAVSEENSD